VLVWNDADIPLTRDAFAGKNQIGINFTVADCLSEGFSRVPYSLVNGTYKSESTAKPLSERCLWPDDQDGKLGMLTCWPYSIVEGRPKVCILPLP
jgi:hypothetical protein